MTVGQDLSQVEAAQEIAVDVDVALQVRDRKSQLIERKQRAQAGPAANREPEARFKILRSVGSASQPVNRSVFQLHLERRHGRVREPAAHPRQYTSIVRAP